MTDVPEKILIDTNIIINLEDNKKIGNSYSELNRICGENGIQILIHESSYQDVLQDKDENRKKISLSKLEKYPKVNRTQCSNAQKESEFGPIKSRNDEVDTDLLVSLQLGVVDLLVTQDINLRARVKNTKLEQKTLDTAETLSILNNLFGSIFVDYKHVKDGFCDQYHHSDNFFSSLKRDYGEPEFTSWYEKCMRARRKCWVIEQSGVIAGMIIYKDEDDQEELRTLSVPGDRVLKLCLFKTDESIKGERFGEQLLKTAMDFAYRNGYCSAYLTVFPKHAPLIKLINRFGFIKGSEKKGEDSYYKLTKVSEAGNAMEPFDFHKAFWPCVKHSDVNKYCIPIRPEFHARLFPEADKKLQQQLTLDFDPLPQTPGNAIRKVYICHARLKAMEPGSLLLFYRSTNSVITSIGVLEEYLEADNYMSLTKIVGTRSVYSSDELLDITEGEKVAKVVNFYYAEDFIQPIPLQTLLSYGVLKSPPQSIISLKNDRFEIFFSELLSEKDRGMFYK
jgi:L-amino acid N-acyltransferase YncA